jgi:RNA polymerase sigma-70 factor (ECF subfamily)
MSFLRRFTRSESTNEDAPRTTAVAELPLDEDGEFHRSAEQWLADSESGDESLLVQQARHDHAAFALLYQRYIERIYAYIYHRVGNTQDAEDLTARTFYRALEKLETYEDRGLPFGAWLFRIAHNLIANWYRDRSRRSFVSLDRLWSIRKDGDDPESSAQRNAQHDALWTAINRLPGERRDLLRYKFISHLSNIEIGQLMNKSESAIKSLYFRTLASLRQEMEKMGWGEESIALPAAGQEERDMAQGDGADSVKPKSEPHRDHTFAYEAKEGA